MGFQDLVGDGDFLKLNLNYNIRCAVMPQYKQRKSGFSISNLAFD